jgi:hypothetical protein
MMDQEDLAEDVTLCERGRNRAAPSQETDCRFEFL